jgi:hypothetical protein
MWTIRCALYSTIDAKYSAHQPACAMSTLVLVKSNKDSSAWSGINIQLIVSSLLLQMYRQPYARYTEHLLPNTALVFLVTLRQLCALPYQIDMCTIVILHICLEIQCTCSSLRYDKSGRVRIECNYCSNYSASNIQLNGYPLLLVICRHFVARHTPHGLPSTTYASRFVACQLWSLSNTM